MTGLRTLLGIRREMLFTPYRYAEQIIPPGSRTAYPAVTAAMRRSEDQFREVLSGLEQFRETFSGFSGAEPPEPRWEQDWFPRLDGAVAYAFVRWLQPDRIIEVGSGHSTRFLARAIRDGELATRITSIDPAPRADVKSLAEVDSCRMTIQECDGNRFDQLRSGDFLFIDSSHLLLPGSDVDLLLNRVLPALPSGVVVHIHDMFLPDDYPGEWDWRGYNEQLAVLPLIIGGGFETLWSSRYATTRLLKDVRASAVAGLPLPEGAFETSLWMKKR